MNPSARKIYVAANDNIEKWFRVFYFVFCKLTVPCLICPFLVSCYFLYFATDLDDEAFFLPFIAWYEIIFCFQSKTHVYELCVFRFPFDWRTPFQYPLALFFEAVSAFYTTIFCTSGLVFLIAFCWIILAFAKDIYLKLIALHKCYNKNNKNDLKFMKKLCRLIQMQQNGKQ